MPIPNQKKILVFIAWAFATYLLFLCFREIEIEQAWKSIRQVHPLWLLLGVGGHFLIFIFWAKQWIVSRFDLEGREMILKKTNDHEMD